LSMYMLNNVGESGQNYLTPLLMFFCRDCSVLTELSPS
jgi:hypothetical protein